MGKISKNLKTIEKTNPKTKEIYFATQNNNKLIEARKILTGINILEADLDIPELQGDFEYVATEKAKAAYKHLKKPVFVDDTALCFDALNGMPGIYVKHFLKAIGPKGLYDLLSGFQNKNATAYAMIAYCDKDSCKVFIGECKGRIIPPKNIENSFGWDSIFQPDGYEDSYASMDRQEKNKISHRKKALDKFKEFLFSN